MRIFQQGNNLLVKASNKEYTLQFRRKRDTITVKDQCGMKKVPLSIIAM